jgi:glucose-6-phosphate dehydrogenase assembly protein OpcA
VEEAVIAAPPPITQTPTREVPLKRIPDALRELWRDCVPDTPGGDVSRALTINFVGLAVGGDSEPLLQAVDRLHRRSPCRAFLLLLDESAGEPRAEVAATMRGTGRTRELVLERIAVRMPGAWLQNAPGMIRPLLVNDLRSHLFWGASWPHDEGVFDALARLCDHAVVDSARFARPDAEIERLHAHRHHAPRITDLAWLRLRPWRRALAEAFERFPWHRGLRARATIRHGADALAAAVLLGRWLGERIGAEVEYEGGRAGGQNPEIVELCVGEVEVLVGTDGNQLNVQVTTPEQCFLPWTAPISRGTVGDLLAAAIDLA